VVLRYLILVLVVGSALALNVCLGDVPVSPQAAWSIVTGPPGAPQAGSGLATMIWQIRLPRLLVAFVVGSGLAVSGYLLQSLSRNPLADPYLTGTSSGAGLAVAAATLAGLDFALVPLAAFAGGLAASTVVAAMARSPSGLSVSRLILCGVALSAICSSLITFALLDSGDPARSQGLFLWLAGNIGGRSWSELAASAAYIAVGLAAALVLSKPLRLLSVGVQSAAALGLDVVKAQWALLFAAILTCGASVAVSGLVGFVGLIAPHVARNLFGRDERSHIVSAALIGAALVLLADLAARTLAAGQELPLGTLLSLIGGPFFLWLVLHQRAEGL